MIRCGCCLVRGKHTGGPPHLRNGNATGQTGAGPGRGQEPHRWCCPTPTSSGPAADAVSAGYGSAGERCMAISVVVAVGSVADALVSAIAERIPALTIGPGTDPASQMGPLITAEHRDRVRSYVDGAEGEGAVMAVDGRGNWPVGFFLGCTLLDRVRPACASTTTRSSGQS